MNKNVVDMELLTEKEQEVISVEIMKTLRPVVEKYGIMAELINKDGKTILNIPIPVFRVINNG